MTDEREYTLEEIQKAFADVKFYKYNNKGVSKMINTAAVCSNDTICGIVCGNYTPLFTESED